MRTHLLLILALSVSLQACSPKAANSSNGLHAEAQERQTIEVKDKQSLDPKALQRLLQRRFVLNKNASEIFSYLALTEAIQHNDLKGVASAVKMLLNHTPNPSALAEAASWFLSHGHLAEAELLLRNAQEKLSDDLNIHVMLSEVLLLQNKVNEGITILEQYVKKNPTAYIAKMELALAYLKVEQPQKAFEYFSSLPQTEQTPLVLYYSAMALRELERTNEAIIFLERALEQNPDFLEALLELANMEERNNNFTAAKKHYKKILEVDPHNQEVSHGLVILALKSDDLKTAVEITQDVTSPYTFIVGISASLMEEKKTELVEKYLSQLAKMETPPEELAYLRGALAYEANKDYKKALSYLSEVQPNSRFYKNTLELRIQIYLEEKNYDKALENLELAQKTFKDEVGYYTTIVQIYLLKEEHQKAHDTLKKHLEIAPEDMQAKFYYAFTFSKLNQDDEAIELMENILEEDPENYEALNFIGYTYVEQGKKLDYALELIEKADKLHPDTGFITDSLAWAHYKLKNYEKAWIFIQEALQHANESETLDPSMWDHYGDIAYKLGKLEEAKKGWKRSLEIKADERVTKKLEKIQ